MKAEKSWIKRIDVAAAAYTAIVVGVFITTTILLRRVEGVNYFTVLSLASGAGALTAMLFSRINTSACSVACGAYMSLGAATGDIPAIIFLILIVIIAIVGFNQTKKLIEITKISEKRAYWFLGGELATIFAVAILL